MGPTLKSSVLQHFECINVFKVCNRTCCGTISFCNSCALHRHNRYLCIYWGERERAPHWRVGWRILDMYVQYVCDSVYLYDLFKRRPAPGLGTRSTAKRLGYEAWVRGQEHIYCCMWYISELNCKTMDRQERLRRRREYERARCYAETAKQKELHLIVKVQGSSQG